MSASNNNFFCMWNVHSSYSLLILGGNISNFRQMFPLRWVHNFHSDIINGNPIRNVRPSSPASGPVCTLPRNPSNVDILCCSLRRNTTLPAKSDEKNLWIVILMFEINILLMNFDLAQHCLLMFGISRYQIDINVK